MAPALAFVNISNLSQLKSCTGKIKRNIALNYRYNRDRNFPKCFATIIINVRLDNHWRVVMADLY